MPPVPLVRKRRSLRRRCLRLSFRGRWGIRCSWRRRLLWKQPSSKALLVLNNNNVIAEHGMHSRRRGGARPGRGPAEGIAPIPCPSPTRLPGDRGRIAFIDDCWSGMRLCRPLDRRRQRLKLLLTGRQKTPHHHLPNLPELLLLQHRLVSPDLLAIAECRRTRVLFRGDECDDSVMLLGEASAYLANGKNSQRGPAGTGSPRSRCGRRS